MTCICLYPFRGCFKKFSSRTSGTPASSFIGRPLSVPTMRVSSRGTTCLQSMPVLLCIHPCHSKSSCANANRLLGPNSSLYRQHARLLRPLGDLDVLSQQWAVTASREALKEIDQPKISTIRTCRSKCLTCPMMRPDTTSDLSRA